MLIYLAGAIDMAKPEQQAWRQYAITYLTSCGINVFDPLGAFEIGDPNDNYHGVRKINFEAIKMCDVLLAEAVFDCMHFGTSQDILMAESNGKKVVVWAKSGKLPMYLMPHTVQYSLHECLNTIRLMACEKFGYDVHPDVIRLSSMTDPESGELIGGYKHNNLWVKVKSTHVNAKLPTKAYPNEDAGFDLYACADTVVPPGGTVNIPTGIEIEMPKGYYGDIKGRSSTFVERGIMIGMGDEGTIDNGYRGELCAVAYNIDHDREKLIKAGERVAQLVIHKIEPMEMVWAEELGPSERGKRGFGHSGA
jgi:dUTP pyrophosphatase